MLKLFKSAKVRILAAGVIVAALLMSFSPINIYVNPNPQLNSKSLTLGNNRLVLRIGNVAYASGTLDYGVDGVDDQVQINQALAVLKTHGGGEIILMSGNYSVSASSNISSNVWIRGSGNSTYIKVEDGVVGGWAVFRNDTFAGQSDSTGNYNIRISDMTIDANGSNLASGSISPLVFNNVDYYEIDHVTLKNGYYDGVNPIYPTDVGSAGAWDGATFNWGIGGHIHDNNFKNFTKAAVDISYAANYTTVANNVFENDTLTAGQYGIYQIGSWDTITGNVFRNVYTVYDPHSGSNYSSFTGNVANNIGVFIGGHDVIGATFTGNTATTMITAINGRSFVRNVISDNHFYYITGGYGIELAQDGDEYENTVSGNIIYKVEGKAILAGGLGGNKVYENHIEDVAPLWIDVGIQTAGTNNQVYDNTIIGVSMNASVVKGSSTDVFARNKGYVDSTEKTVYLANIIKTAGNATVMLPFTELAGTTVSDYSKQVNTGTAGTAITSFNTAPSYQGLATMYNFAGGSPEAIVVADNTNLTFDDTAGGGALTFIFVGNPSTDNVSKMLISKYDDTIGGEYEWSIPTTNKMYFGMRDMTAAKTSYVMSNSAVSVGGLHVWAVTYDGRGGATAASGVTLYQDGVVIASTATNDGAYVGMRDGALPVRIGAEGHGGAGTYTALYKGSGTLPIMIHAKLSADDIWAITRQIQSYLGQ